MEPALTELQSYHAMYGKMNEVLILPEKRNALRNASLISFHGFAKLPVELQIEIWKAFFVLSIQDPFILYVFLGTSLCDLCPKSTHSQYFVPLSHRDASYMPDLDNVGRTNVHMMLLASKLSRQIAREGLARLYIETESEYKEVWKDLPWNFLLPSQHGQDEAIFNGARKVVFETPTSGLLMVGHYCEEGCLHSRTSEENHP